MIRSFRGASGRRFFSSCKVASLYDTMKETHERQEGNEDPHR